jgi:hypothetical protein
MQDHHHITQNNVEFPEYATITGSTSRFPASPNRNLLTLNYNQDLYTIFLFTQAQETGPLKDSWLVCPPHRTGSPQATWSVHYMRIGSHTSYKFPLERRTHKHTTHLDLISEQSDEDPLLRLSLQILQTVIIVL